MSLLQPKMLKPMSTSEAIAYAVKQANVDVIAAYPITPQTIIVERLSEYVNNGELDAEYVAVESEHSAMSACVAASLTGARVFTSTASQGLALMHEVLYVASSLRCPIVMAIANRALSAPINIHCDHSDVMGSRDAGWVHIFVENGQQAYDRVFQAFRLAEDEDVLLPVGINLDGFFLSHAVEGIATISDSEAATFLPPRKAKYYVDSSMPMTFGAFALPDWYFEIKHQVVSAMEKVPKKLEEVEKLYYQMTGRIYGHVGAYKTEDAEVGLVCAGSAAATARYAISRLREKGIKAGLLSIRLFRPFPVESILPHVKDMRALVVMDRAMSPGAPSAPIGQDIKTMLYDAGLRRNIPVVNFVYGLGGRDISVAEFEEIVTKVAKDVKAKRRIQRGTIYWGLRS